jgi:hypothetical protein
MSILDIQSELNNIKNTITDNIIINDKLKINNDKLKINNDKLESHNDKLDTFIQSKVINIYMRPWNKLEIKLKIKKIIEFIKSEIDNNLLTNCNGELIINKLTKMIYNKKLLKVDYNIEECRINSLDYSNI